MKPAPFDYHAPRIVDDAVSMLAEFAGQGGRVIAGGQSLVPMMAFRLARPSHLIDINGVGELDCLLVEDATLWIGATVRHAALANMVSGGTLGDCSVRSRVAWPTRRSVIAARSAGVWRMQIRQRNGAWRRQRWMRGSSLAARAVSVR